MLNFCTLFDSNYIVKGLCMYNSLKNVCADFHLYIFAFDEKAYSILRNMKLESVSVISLEEFEDEELLNVKDSRSKGEYCWTCASSTILYCIQKFQLDSCTYLDADLFFYSDPKVLIDEMGDKDVQITSHRYTPEYDQTALSGKYCVQFMTFRNTANGLNVLNWWRDACLNWCYNRIEDGKFGDQKYLDDWTIRFNGIHELEHLGGGVAPWNMQQYTFQKKNSGFVGTELLTGHRFDLVFFHFHALLSFKNGFLRKFYFQSYLLPGTIKKVLYLPYVNQLKTQFVHLKKIDKKMDGLATKEVSLLNYLKSIGRSILKHNNKYYFWIK